MAVGPYIWHASMANSNVPESYLGTNIESDDDNSWTPLHFVARYGHVEIVKLLLKPEGEIRGAELRKRTTGGPGFGELDDCTALDLAKSNGHGDIICILLEAGDILTPRKE